LIFLGTVTFVRVLENSIEDTIYAMAINRIRQYYIDQAGEDARYFTLTGHDDIEGAYANMGLASSRWRPFFSIGAVLALINSMVVGALVGVALDALASRAVVLLVGVLVTAAAFGIHYGAGGLDTDERSKAVLRFSHERRHDRDLRVGSRHRRITSSNEYQRHSGGQ
jgi:hypothetical protein